MKSYFPVIENYLAWKIAGNGTQVITRENAIMSCGNSIFPIDLIYFLQEIDFFTLNHVKDPLTIDVWQ